MDNPGIFFRVFSIAYPPEESPAPYSRINSIATKTKSRAAPAEA